MKFIIVIVLVTCQICHCVIYRLNDTEYFRMPPVFHLDDYDSCIHQTKGIYCYVTMSLVSDIPSDLLQMIKEYSEHTSTHFNHTQLHYGICLTKTCKHVLQHNKVVDPGVTLEKCLNESLWREYKLKTRLSNLTSCEKLDDPMVINAGDITAAIFFTCLALLNIIGSLYDLFLVKEGIGHRLLLSFSFKRNLEKLVTIKNKDPFHDRLKGIHGLRVLSIMLVIFGHVPVAFIINSENPYGLEKTYDNILFHIFYNGNLIVQTFFIMTGFLMAFNLRTYFEKTEPSWTLILKGIMMRWLRLTPAYAVVLIFTVTWMRHVASGPLWQVAVGAEVAGCQRFGWSHMIYLNNYIDYSICMIHTWYLAADMQLYILGLFVCILTRTSKSRKIVLSILFIFGSAIPAVHTYIQDLDAIILVTPETVRSVFATDSTFNNSYKRGHTNIPAMVIGLALGNLIYEGLMDESKINIYKKLGFLYYLTVPMGFGLVLTGSVFYGDRPRPSIYIRAALAALIRPLYGLLVSIFFIGMVFKFENLYRRIIEWRGWRIPARVSYSAYLIHFTIIWISAGINTTLSRIGILQCLQEAVGINFISFLLAYPMWLFVEAPLNQAILIILGLTKEKNYEDNKKMDNIVTQREPDTTVQATGNHLPEINIRI